MKALHWPTTVKTIWSVGSSILAPPALLRFITVVLPLMYILFGAYAIGSIFVPLTSFVRLVGTFYPVAWALLLTASCVVGLVTLIFRHPAERYAVAILAILLSVYEVYTVYLAAVGDQGRLPIVFAVGWYCVIPWWRAVTLVREIREARLAELRLAIQQ
jgi:hypothetical protein